jgi:hypothetical protein
MTSERLALITEAASQCAAVLLLQLRDEVQAVLDDPTTSFVLRAQAVTTRDTLDAHLPGALALNDEGREILKGVADAFEADAGLELTDTQRASLNTAMEVFAVETQLSGHIAVPRAA